MNIAVIAHLKYPISEPFHGGLEMHTHVLCEELMGRGHRVTLFALGTSDARFNVIEPPLREVEMGKGKDLWEENPAFEMKFIDKLHAYLDVMRRISLGNFDVVHNNCLHFIPLSFAHVLPCPMVTALHTPPFPSLQSAALLARKYEGNRFVSVSGHLTGQWSNYINEADVVYNGVKLENWTFSAKPEPKTAVWVGRFCPEKGPEYAIQIARRAGYRLKMAGSVYDQAYYDAEIKPLLGNDVEHVGHLDHAGINRLIGASEIGLFTSTWDEPFGLVLTEMLACGTPIVAFDSGAAAEVIDARSGVIVPKFDVEAAAAAIPRAAGLDRRACRERVARKFRVEVMIDGYERVYRKMTAAKTVSLDPVLAPGGVDSIRPEQPRSVELSQSFTTHVA